MAKYLKEHGERVSFQGDEVRVDTKGRLYIFVDGKKTYVKKVNGIIHFKGES